MKFTTIFCLLSIISIVSALLIRHRVHRVHHKRGVGRGIFLLCKGAIEVLAGSPGLFEECLPKNLQTSPQEEAGATSIAAPGPWETVLKVVGTIIDVACKFKPLLFKFMGGRRLFYQVARTRRGKGFIKSIKNAFNKVKSGVVNAAKKVASVAKSVIDKLNPIELVKKIVNAIKGVFNKIKDFFKNTVPPIISFLMCVLRKKESIKNLFKVIRGFINNVKTLMGGVAGLVKVIINCVCNWKEFKKAVEYLLTAIKSSGEKRWHGIGRFAGQLAYAIGTS